MNSKKIFNSANDWTHFCFTVMHKNRYFLDKKQKKFLDTLLSSIQPRIIKIPEKTILHRARIGYKKLINRKPVPYQSGDISAPKPKETKEGRVAPKGISCLYLADSEKTAIMEVRAGMQDIISVGEFEIAKEITIIDLTKDYLLFFNRLIVKASPLSNEQLEKFIWSEINDSFSQLVKSGEELNYISTQWLSSYFSEKGYHGIKYKSFFHEDAYNVTLFDPKSFVSWKSSQCFVVDKLNPVISSRSKKFYV